MINMDTEYVLSSLGTVVMLFAIVGCLFGMPLSSWGLGLIFGHQLHYFHAKKQ